MDLVSVIVPVYNVEMYLHRCIESVLAQTYKEIELILVDDGSLDQSGKICDEYGKRENVKVFHEENKGQSSARNVGLDNATGKWIIFLDSDDFMEREFVSYMLGLCHKYHVKIAQCGAIRGKEDHFPEESSQVLEKKWNFDELYASATRQYRSVVWAKIYDAELYNDYRFPVGMIFEDEDAVFKIMYQAGEVIISNRHLYYYFMSEQSTLRKKRERICFDFVTIFENRIRLLQQNGEVFLIGVTEKELCIRLMMNYVEAVEEKIIKDDIGMLRKLFAQHYKSILDKGIIPTKERAALFLFYKFPRLFAFVENHVSFIEKKKHKRERA